jgi:hypothetical protein
VLEAASHAQWDNHWEKPSRTGLSVAAHQTLHGGSIFSDPLALRILGPEADAIIRKLPADPAKRERRLFLTDRSRFRRSVWLPRLGVECARL